MGEGMLHHTHFTCGQEDYLLCGLRRYDHNPMLAPLCHFPTTVGVCSGCVNSGKLGKPCVEPRRHLCFYACLISSPPALGDHYKHGSPCLLCSSPSGNGGKTDKLGVREAGLWSGRDSGCPWVPRLPGSALISKGKEEWQVYGVPILLSTFNHFTLFSTKNSAR